jgi:hypothetical protein
MRLAYPALISALLFSPFATFAQPEAALREAVSALAATSYRWETTVRQRFSADNNQPRLNPGAPLEVKGMIDPNGFSQIVLLPSSNLAVSVTAVSREGDVVAHTPLGWLRRTAMRQATDREVTFEGKQVRLSRFVNVALKVTAMRPLAEDLFDLIEDLKSCRAESGLIVAELRDRTIERLWGDERAKSAPEIMGTMIFKMGDDGLTEFHVVLGIGFPNSRTQNVAWTMQQWTTRVGGIGSTTVEPPAGALKAMEE